MNPTRVLFRGVSAHASEQGRGVSGKVVASVVGSLLLGVVGYGGVYLPYYSEGSYAARDRAVSSGMAAARRRADAETEKFKVERAPGSVWKNIAIKREGTSGEEGSSGWPSLSRDR